MNLLLIAVAGLLGTADIPDAAVKTEMEKLEGNWKIVAVEEEGKTLADVNLNRMPPYVFRAGKLVVKDPTKALEATFKIDPTKSPKEMDVTQTSAGKPNTQLAIYELNGDELRVCAARTNGTERPTDFVSKKGSGITILTFKREKP